MRKWMRLWILVLVLVVVLVLGGCKRRERGSMDGAARGVEMTRAAGEIQGGGGLCTWKFKYGENDRLIGLVLPDSREITYGYDSRGNVSSLVSTRFKEGYEYDFFNFLSKISDSTGETLLKRDFTGNLTEMVYPTGDRVKYEYGDTGRVRAVTWGERHYLRFFRDLMGNMIRLESPAGAINMQYDYDQGVMERILPNGARSRFEFDTNGRPKSIRHLGPQGNVLLEFRYTYDGAGLVTSAVERTAQGTKNIDYSYDEYDQLIKAVYSDGRVYAYEYDDRGNCLEYSSPTGKQTASYDAYDRLVSVNGKKVAHDRCGNLAALGGTEFYYNVKNLMESDGKYSYRYDGLNLRVETLAREGNSRFIHFLDDLPYVLAETGKTEKHYLWADGRCLGEIDGDRRVLFYFEDHLGSIRGAVDNNGQWLGEAEFSPFGVPVKRIAGLRFGYAGEEQDEDGKVYLRSRYYLPQVGRFISMDPAPLRLEDTIKQNRYAYAGNSPLNYRDADGAYPGNNDDFWRNFNRLVQYPIYMLSPQGVIDQMNRMRESAINLNKRYDETYRSIPNTWGFREPNRWFSEGGRISNFAYIVPTMSHTALWHDAFLESFQVGKLPAFLEQPINVGSMPFAWSFGTAHFITDYIFGPESTGGLKSWLWDKAHPASTREQEYKFGKPIYGYEGKLDIDYDDDFYPFFPPDDWGGGLGGGLFDSPNVGGVYLDKAAEVLGKLGGIEGVAFDPITNRVLLIGGDRGRTELPPVRLEDLAAAFRTVFGDFDTEPGVTIDPDPKNPRAAQMIVRFFGGMENTYFGYQLFEADRLMKSLSLGQDNISEKPVKANIAGYYNMLDLGFSNLGGSHRQDLWSRFWLVPDQVIVRVSDDKKSITFPDTRIRVKTETMRWQGGQLVPVKGEKDDKAEYFAAHFTRYYDDYAKAFPVFRDLKTLANLVGLAKWLKEAAINADFTWLKDYEKTYATPDKTPSLTVSGRQGNRVISVFGGTDLTVQNYYVKDDGSAAKLIQPALAVKGADTPGLTSFTFPGADGQLKRAVALPTLQTRAAGGKMMRDAESGLFARVYCSFHNEPGPFGHSWFLDAPRLIISRPERGKIEYVTVGNRQVMVRKFRLIGPFGSPDVVFEKQAVDQQYGRISFLPNVSRGIRALYVDEEKKEFRVEYSDGRASVFDRLGRILRREDTSTDYLGYSYDQNNRLKSIDRVIQGKTADQALFSYDRSGRIESARAKTGDIRYEYNLAGDLVKVSGNNLTTGYTYNGRHLVTGVMRNGKEVDRLAYDEWGRVLSGKYADGSPLVRTIGSKTGQTELVENIGNRQVVRVYDAGGRLLEFRDPSRDLRLKTEYDAFGARKSVQWQNGKGESMKADYSPDGRYIRYTFPGGQVRALLYDEYGRLKQVQDQKYAVLNQEYSLTDRGWFEGAETSEVKMQSFYTGDRQPLEGLLTSKVPGGGFLKLANTYTKEGGLRVAQIQGLLNRDYRYDQGRLKRITGKNENIDLEYDTTGRLIKAVSADRQLFITYDVENRVSRIQEKTGSGEVVYEFSNGLLSRRKTLAGRVDTFGLDDEGLLKSATRGSQESWQIQYEPRRIRILRNGVVFEESLFDDHGRLLQLRR